MFTIIDQLLGKMPLEGYRTIILGYLSTVTPLVLEVVESGVSGSEFYFRLSFALGGPLIHYFRRKAIG